MFSTDEGTPPKHVACEVAWSGSDVLDFQVDELHKIRAIVLVSPIQVGLLEIR